VKDARVLSALGVPALGKSEAALEELRSNGLA
jgi:hypothetical protein